MRKQKQIDSKCHFVLAINNDNNNNNSNNINLLVKEVLRIQTTGRHSAALTDYGELKLVKFHSAVHVDI